MGAAHNRNLSKHTMSPGPGPQDVTMGCKKPVRAGTHFTAKSFTLKMTLKAGAHAVQSPTLMQCVYWTYANKINIVLLKQWRWQVDQAHQYWENPQVSNPSWQCANSGVAVGKHQGFRSHWGDTRSWPWASKMGLQVVKVQHPCKDSDAHTRTMLMQIVENKYESILGDGTDAI